jgi:hypothetical protein
LRPDSSSPVAADVGGVASNAPTFSQGQPLTITVSAEDDDGTLSIISHLPGSQLLVTSCTGIGEKVPGRCDSNGMSAVGGQESTYITVNTDSLDNDDSSELLYVTLTLSASCNTVTVVTISANQPGNVGPDDVTVNCVPPTPTPTATPSPTLTPTPTKTPAPEPTSTASPVPTSTPVVTGTPGFTPSPVPTNAVLFDPPPTPHPYPTYPPYPPYPTPPQPPPQYISSVLSLPIIPPNTGDAGLVD